MTLARWLVLTLLGLFLGAAAATAALNDEEIRQCYIRSYRYEVSQNYKDALKAMLLVSDAYPLGYTVNLRLGWLYYLNANYASSRRHYETAIQVAPSSLEAKLGYTLPLMAQERWSDVEAFSRQVVTIDPCSLLGNLRLALALRLQGKLDVAEKVDSGMLVLYPTDVRFLLELALVKSAQKDKVAARRLLGDVLILDPENVTAKQMLDKL